jgi:hypothetical protein
LKFSKRYQKLDSSTPMREWTFLGRTIRAWVSPALTEVLHRLIDFPELAAFGSSNWQIRIVQSAEPAPLLEGTYPIKVHNGSVNVLTTDHGCWISTEDAAIQLEFDDAGVELTLFGEEASLPICLGLAVIEAIRASGLLPMHAAIATHAGVGLALTGTSGTGKTTTSIQALSLGYAPVSEDFAWLEPRTMRVHSVDRGLHCLPDTLARALEYFPYAKPIQANPRKMFIPFAQIATQTWECGLHAIWKLERQPELPSAVIPLSSAERVMTLFETTGLPLTLLTRAQAAAVIPRLAGELEIAKLRIGNTPLPFPS